MGIIRVFQRERSRISPQPRLRGGEGGILFPQFSVSSCDAYTWRFYPVFARVSSVFVTSDTVSVVSLVGYISRKLVSVGISRKKRNFVVLDQRNVSPASAPLSG